MVWLLLTAISAGQTGEDDWKLLQAFAQFPAGEQPLRWPGDLPPAVHHFVSLADEDPQRDASPAANPEPIFPPSYWNAGGEDLEDGRTRGPVQLAPAAIPFTERNVENVLPDGVQGTDPTVQAPWSEQLERHLLATSDSPPTADPAGLPTGYQPWWQPEVMRPLRAGSAALSIDLDQLLVEALQYSAQVQAIRETEFIRSTSIVEASADFDSQAFIETKFNRTSDPVGDTLTTGGPPRFRDSDWYYQAGTRKRTKLGGNFEISQRIGYRDNNSQFLTPTQQGNARLSISLTQPLLRGAGRKYNQSRVVLAQLDTQAAADEVSAGLLEHLEQVNRAYWDLYLRRAVLKQRRRHFERANEILRRLEERSQVDVLLSQLLSARAAVSLRATDLNRAEMAIRNAESRLRILVGSPRLYGAGPQELLPLTPLSNEFEDVGMRDALATALYRRPDVDRALQETHKASVRLNMSTQELLPMLDLVLETYVAGLEGRSQVGQAWLNQFNRGEPGYTAGFVFEISLHNRLARIRHERRLAELRQATSELRATVDTAMLEVEIAVREVQTSFRDILAHFRSMAATQAEVDYLLDRWKLLPGDDRSASFLLEDLFKAQDRLADTEFGFVEAQVSYAMARVQLKRAMGILMVIDAADAGPPLIDAPAAQHVPAPQPAVPLESADRRLRGMSRLPPVR